MRSDFVAEWILARFTTRSRAASIVGDLLENRCEKGTLWFWRSFAGIVLAVAWRWPFAFASAFYLGLHALGALQMPIYGVNAAHRPPQEWMLVFDVLPGLGMLLWMAAPYAAIRFGLRDSFRTACLGVWGIGYHYHLLLVDAGGPDPVHCSGLLPRRGLNVFCSAAESIAGSRGRHCIWLWRRSAHFLSGRTLSEASLSRPSG